MWSRMELLRIKPLCLVGIVILLAVQSGCDSSHSKFVTAHPNRVVSISSVTPGSSNPCEVDFPVTLLRKGKHHTIAWAAEDHDYWIKFDSGSPIGLTQIKVANGTQAGPYPISISLTSPIYFMYSIYDVDPTSNPTATACKAAADDRDTGLNVKP
jgi:hypothetical protein